MLKSTTLFALVVSAAFAVLATDAAQAAQKVKTKKIELQAEQASPPAGDGIEKEEEEQTAEPVEIPTDELPDVSSDGGLTPNTQPAIEPPAETPDIETDFSKLPEPVQRMRELLLEAARSGEIERLRSLIGIGETATTLSIGGLEGDPIEFLKEASGDNEGFETLGILVELLETGYVHLDPGGEGEIYVWPYFFAVPFDDLTPRQRVELYTILTAGDVEDSTNFGGYIFYRVGIKPDGQWSFFVAGD